MLCREVVKSTRWAFGALSAQESLPPLFPLTRTVFPKHERSNLTKAVGGPELSLKRKQIFLPPRGRKLIFPMHPAPSSCSDKLNFLLCLMKMDQSQAMYSGESQSGKLNEGARGQKQSFPPGEEVINCKRELE